MSQSSPSCRAPPAGAGSTPPPFGSEVVHRGQRSAIQNEAHASTAGATGDRSLTSTTMLFMWELVAVFSPPKTVCTLEHLTKRVREVLLASSTGTNLLQRYWNAQYHRLVWSSEHLDASKRFLTFTLSRSEGKKPWKARYAEEWPLYLQRTLQGHGVSNNATNAARLEFKREQLNDVLSGEQLAAMQLTEAEALQKAITKNAVTAQAVLGNNSSVASGALSHTRVDGKGRRRGGERKAQPMKDPSLGLTRNDYRDDLRQGSRKGKHKKGGENRWDSYAYNDEE